MPKGPSGKWVARAAATGGGRTYRGQVPVNWYAALVLIVIVGLASVVFARVEYERGPTVNTTPPLKGGAAWFAAIDFDVCGTQKPSLPSNVVDATKQSFFTEGNGVIIIDPKQTSDAGHNAVLGKFISSYNGLELTATTLHLPPATPTSTPTSTPTPTPTSTPTSTSTAKGSKTSKGKSGKKSRSAKAATGTTYRNGEKCPSGTKDAGKKADVKVTYWPNAFSSKERPQTVQGDPSVLRFSNDQLITVGFVPPGTSLPKPSGTIVTALLDATSGASSTTTTTTAPSTSKSKSTTTTSGTTSSTSTTAPSSSTTSTTKG